MSEFKPDNVDKVMLACCAFGGWALRAWVSVKGWLWFIVPLGAPELGFGWMVAAVWVLGALIPVPENRIPAKTEQEYIANASAKLAAPIMALIVLAILRGLNV